MLKKLKPKSEFSRNVLTLMTGTTLAQAIPIAISPILTRIYTPEDFGVFALFISIVGIMAVVSTGKYELSLILPKKDSFAYQLLILSGLLVLGAASVYLVGILLVSLFYNFDYIFYLLPITVIFIGLNNTFDKYNNRVKNYKLMSYQRVIKTTVESLISISFMLLFSIKTGLVWGFVLGFFVSNIIMLLVNIKIFQKKAFEVSKKKMKVLAKRYENFLKYNMPHALLNTVSVNIPIFLIPLYYGSYTLGLYAFGLKIVQAPLSLISSSMLNVLGQKMAEEYSQGNEIKSLFISTVKKLMLLVVLMLPLFIFIDDLFAFIFGEEWRVSGFYVQILSPWILLVFVVSPFATIPHIYKQQKKAFKLEILYTALRIAPFVIGSGMFHMPLDEVLKMYMLLATLLLIYGFNWYFSLLKRGEV